MFTKNKDASSSNDVLYIIPSEIAIFLPKYFSPALQFYMVK